MDWIIALTVVHLPLFVSTDAVLHWQNVRVNKL